jgi:hypothetical protein
MAVAALAMLVVLLAPLATNRSANAIAAQPVLSGGFGLLTLIAAVFGLLLLAVTIILSPFSLIGFLILGIAVLFGWVAVGTEVGRRMATLFKTSWAEPVAAGIGTLTISLITAWFGWIPCIGWIIAPVFAMVGLGGVALTRFGTRPYTPPASPTTVVMPVGPATAQPGSGAQVYDIPEPPVENTPDEDRPTDLPPSL